MDVDTVSKGEKRLCFQRPGFVCEAPNRRAKRENQPGGPTVKVTDVVPEFADAFDFDEFNQMQKEAAPAIIDNTENIVTAAPTASGKTALAELAICRTLANDGTALFIAPLRALTNEKEAEWERFESLGYSVYVVTGERELNPRRAERADILVMTPEKTDSATRKHQSARYAFVTDIDCCVIDEVHLLDSAARGGVLEVTVSRLRRLCDPRIIALSATMPNIDDVAANDELIDYTVQDGAIVRQHSSSMKSTDQSTCTLTFKHTHTVRIVSLINTGVFIEHLILSSHILAKMDRGLSLSHRGKMLFKQPRRLLRRLKLVLRVKSAMSLAFMNNSPI